MRAPRTLSIYIAIEVLQYTLLGLLAITVLLFSNRVMRWVTDFIGAGLSWVELLGVARLFATMLVVHALPIALLFGVLLAVGRMAADVELIAMRACGVGLAAISAPILALGVAVSGVLWPLSLDVEPAAQREVTRALAKIIMRGATLEPGRFRQVAGRVFYADRRDADGRFYGIVISDRSQLERPLLIFAESAELRLDEETAELTLRLENGDIHVEPPGEDGDLYHRIAFASFDYAIDVAGVLSPGAGPRAREMTVPELRETWARVGAGDPGPYREDEPSLYGVHLHRRLAAPLAPTVFTLVAVPIAMQRRRGARSKGLMFCAALGFGYYALGSFGEGLVASGWLPAAAAAWIPNAAYAALGVLLMARARHAGA